ncbi:hypothetical protein BB560_004324, partial [Smittium megazygosporum]
EINNKLKSLVENINDTKDILDKTILDIFFITNIDFTEPAKFAVISELIKQNIDIEINLTSLKFSSNMKINELAKAEKDKKLEEEMNKLNIVEEKQKNLESPQKLQKTSKDQETQHQSPEPAIVKEANLQTKFKKAIK